MTVQSLFMFATTANVGEDTPEKSSFETEPTRQLGAFFFSLTQPVLTETRLGRLLRPPCPTWQTLLLPAWTAADAVPAGHCSHAVDPATFEYSPAEHGSQESPLPTLTPAVPAGQGRHSVLRAAL